MPKIASVIVWDEEPLDEIKEAVESCNQLAEAIAKSNLPAENYSYCCILATAQRNISDHPGFEQWSKSLPSSLDLKTSIAEMGFEYATIVANASSIRTADCLVFHDMNVSGALNWIMAELREIARYRKAHQLPENCLIVARNRRDTKIHIAICPSQEAYFSELAMFSPEDKYRKTGWFKKEEITIGGLNDFVDVMLNVAKRKGWAVKEPNAS